MQASRVPGWGLQLLQGSLVAPLLSLRCKIRYYYRLHRERALVEKDGWRMVLDPH